MKVDFFLFFRYLTTACSSFIEREKWVYMCIYTMISPFSGLYSVCQKRFKMFAKSGIYYSCVRSNMVWLVIKTMTSNVECMTFRQMGKKKWREDSMDRCVIVKIFFLQWRLQGKKLIKLYNNYLDYFLNYSADQSMN